mgnify:CR=1 FL=1
MRRIGERLALCWAHLAEGCFADPVLLVRVQPLQQALALEWMAGDVVVELRGIERWWVLSVLPVLCVYETIEQLTVSGIG